MLRNLRLHYAQRSRTLGSSLYHFPLYCSSHTSEIRDFARCRGSIKVTMCFNIEGIDSAVHVGRLVKNNRMVHFLVNSDTQTKTLHFPRTPTEAVTKSILELFKLQSRNASDDDILDVRCCQSERGSKTFRGENPNCRVRPCSPSLHGRQEPVNREPPTSLRIAESTHNFREFHCPPKGMFMAHAISSSALAHASSLSCISCPSPCTDADLAPAHSNSA